LTRREIESAVFSRSPVARAAPAARARAQSAARDSVRPGRDADLGLEPLETSDGTRALSHSVHDGARPACRRHRAAELGPRVCTSQARVAPAATTLLLRAETGTTLSEIPAVHDAAARKRGQPVPHRGRTTCRSIAPIPTSIGRWIHDGVIAFVTTTIAPELDDALAFVLVRAISSTMAASTSRGDESSRPGPRSWRTCPSIRCSASRVRLRDYYRYFHCRDNGLSSTRTSGGRWTIRTCV